MPLDADAVRAEAKADMEVAQQEIDDLVAQRDDINKAIKAKRAVLAEKQSIYKRLQPRKSKRNDETGEVEEVAVDAEGDGEIVDPVATDADVTTEAPEPPAAPEFDPSAPDTGPDPEPEKGSKAPSFTPPDL